MYNVFFRIGDCIVKELPDNVIVRFPPKMFYFGVGSGDSVNSKREKEINGWVELLNRTYSDGYYQHQIDNNVIK